MHVERDTLAESFRILSYLTCGDDVDDNFRSHAFCTASICRRPPIHGTLDGVAVSLSQGKS